MLFSVNKRIVLLLKILKTRKYMGYTSSIRIMWEDAGILAMQVMQLVPKAEDCMHNKLNRN